MKLAHNRKKEMPRDICKGFRECYNAVMKAVVSNAIITGVLMGIPSYYLITGLLMHGSVISYSPAYVSIANNASGPFFTLLGFTLLAWVIGCVSIKLMMPNVLGIMAFGHSAIGSWWLVNFAIIFIGGWSYIPAGIMMLILMGIIVPGILWHLTADIIRAYKHKLIDEIASASLASQAVGTGEDKV